MTPHPPVVRSARVTVAPTEAFRIFTEEIGAWWPLPTHGAFGDRAGGLSFRNSQLVEQAIDGSEVVWGEVLVWEPPTRLTITWHPGQAASPASQVEVTFDDDGDGTRVIIEHRGWEAFGEHALERRRSYIGPGAWGHVLDHYADGVEPRPDAADLQPLITAYDRLFEEFGRGGFGPAPNGEWNADQVIAHVALNDAAMLGVCQQIIHQRELRFESTRFENTVALFENAVCQDLDVLGKWIGACSDHDEMITRGRLAASNLVAAARRLSKDQREALVHCRIEHDHQVVLDEPRPWGPFTIDSQAAMHLPAHISQLQNLRPNV